MMKKHILKGLALFSFLQIIVGISLAQKTKVTQTLWYDSAAKNWLEALPLGNGTIGAMVFGGVQNELIQFNESSLVSGSPTLMGSYQPFGTIKISQKETEYSNYHRRLCLDSALQTVTYKTSNANYKREYFISYPDKALIVRYSATTPKSLNCTIELTDAHKASIVANGQSITATGMLKENSMQYQSRLSVKVKGGTQTVNGQSIVVSNADEFTLYLLAATSFENDANKGFVRQLPIKELENQLNLVSNTPYQKLLQRHLDDYTNLYNRVRISLGEGNYMDTTPTNKRLIAYGLNKGKDNGLEVLLYQYGRYLLISSSRKGGLPSNLQGIWNNDVKPAWYSQYTTDINVEMNYWLAETTNLSECHFPLFKWVENLEQVCKQSQDSALKTNKGWLEYSTNNIFGGSSKWKINRPGAAWLSQHFWEHYAFTLDKDFLAQRAYPFLKEIAEYWEGHLVENKEGKLISPDAWSPEHGPNLKEGDKTHYPGAAYDQQIVYDLFSNYIDAENVLNKDNAYKEKIMAIRNKMLPPLIGKWGQLQEWMEDVDRKDDHHRHNSHLFGVYPGRQISPILTPDWAKASVVSLDARGNESTGWSTAWRIGIYARLMEGEKAIQKIRKQIYPAPSTIAGIRHETGLYPNLFNAYPFQIDGNFGYTASVTEMLLQSHEGFIHFLPALPTAWKDGYIKGLKARGNLTIDLFWKDKKLNKAIIKPTFTGQYQFRIEDKTKTMSLVGGKEYVVDGDLKELK